MTENLLISILDYFVSYFNNSNTEKIESEQRCSLALHIAHYSLIFIFKQSLITPTVWNLTPFPHTIYATRTSNYEP